jgi:polyhydroxybutyrate depolymerase
VSDTFCVDERRVYATGISNGGMLAIRLACELSERFAAVAPVAATLTYNACAPTRSVPLMHIHGDADAHVPIGGGFGCGPSGVEYKSLDQSMALWAEENACTGDAVELLREGNGICASEGACDAETIRCVVEDGGHDWHGGPPREGSLPACDADGAQSQTFNASEQIWQFFSRQHLAE